MYTQACHVEASQGLSGACAWRNLPERFAKPELCGGFEIHRRVPMDRAIQLLGGNKNKNNTERKRRIPSTCFTSRSSRSFSLFLFSFSLSPSFRMRSLSPGCLSSFGMRAFFDADSRSVYRAVNVKKSNIRVLRLVYICASTKVCFTKKKKCTGRVNADESA